MSRSQFAGHGHRPGDIDAGRTAHRYAFIFQQVVDHGQCVIVVDAAGIIQFQALEVARYEGYPDALGDGFPLGLQAGSLEMTVQGRPHGIGQAYFYRRVLFPQGLGHAGQGAAGAHRADEAVDLAAGLLPDFPAGGVTVDLAVGEIVELARPDGAVGFFPGPSRRDALGSVNIVVGVAVGHGGDQQQLRSQHLQLANFFLAGILRHHDDALVAQGIGHQGEADAGIARGAFDDHAAGLQFSRLLRRPDDAQGGAVLDRAAGVHELGFSVYVAAGQLRGLAQVQ